MKQRFNDQLDSILCYAAQRYVEDLKAADSPSRDHAAYRALAELFEHSTVPVGLSPITIEAFSEALMEADFVIDSREYQRPQSH